MRTCLSDPTTFVVEVEPPLAASDGTRQNNPQSILYSVVVRNEVRFVDSLRGLSNLAILSGDAELHELGTWRSPQPHWLFGMFRYTIVGRSHRFSDSTTLASVL